MGTESNVAVYNKDKLNKCALKQNSPSKEENITYKLSYGTIFLVRECVLRSMVKDCSGFMLKYSQSSQQSDLG